MLRIELPEVLDQRAAQTVADHLLSHRGEVVTLDASHVRRLGAIGAEMLIAAQKQWLADETHFSVSGWSQEAQDALGEIGLSTEDFAEEAAQ